MAIINNSYGFIFVHVPKSAGTTISREFSPYTNYCDLELGGTVFGEGVQRFYASRFGIRKHSTASDLKAVVGDVVWGKYFSFAFVRNPYDRCLSMFNFLRKWESPAKEFNRKIREFETFKQFVCSGMLEATSGPDNIFRPQVFWLRATPRSQNLLVDYVAKVESIDQELEKIRAVIGLRKMADESSEVAHLNRSTDDGEVDLADQEVLDEIYRIYKQDFQMLGYDRRRRLAKLATEDID